MRPEALRAGELRDAHEVDYRMMWTIAKERISMRLTVLIVAAMTAGATAAADGNPDVQRQLQQREQQQMELRLKMQQQLDRSTLPPQSPSADLRMRQLDRDQQQRLQQFNERETRGGIAPATPGAAEYLRRELERQRGPQAGMDTFNRPGTGKSFPVDSGGGP